MRDPQPDTPDWNTEGEVIRMLRMCPTCRPADYVLCEPHAEIVTALYPPCEDPACPACVSVGRRP